VLHPLYILFDHNGVYILQCDTNDDSSLSIFITLTHSLYLMFSHCPLCPIEHNKKTVMTTNHLTAGTQATPTVSDILNLLQTKGNRQHKSIIYQTLL
jgi:hypothetical protein